MFYKFLFACLCECVPKWEKNTNKKQTFFFLYNLNFWVLWNEIENNISWSSVQQVGLTSDAIMMNNLINKYSKY